MQNMPTQQQMPQGAQGAPASYGRQLNQQFARVGVGAQNVGAAAMGSGGGSGSGGGAMNPHFGSAPRQQAPTGVSDSTTPRYQLNLDQSQSTAPARDRTYPGVASGHRGGGSAGYYPQTQVPQPSYGQGRPTTPGGYGAQGGYGYPTSTPTASSMYRSQGGTTPHAPVTPTAQQSAYGMRYGQAPNSYQQFQAPPSSYGQHYPGVGARGYPTDQSATGASAMGGQAQGGSGFQQQYAPQQMQHGGGGRHQQSAFSQGGHAASFRGRGRGRGSLDQSAASGGPPSVTPRQASATTVDSSGPTASGPEATEDPNVPPEKPITRRVGIEPPIRNLLQYDQPMFNEPERFFRVLTFDVLGDKVPRSARAYQKPPSGRQDFWSWEYRKDFLIKEITQFQPDIICLQEVDHYDFFEQKLAPLGYVGIFEQRKPTGQSRLYVVHGLAIFWQMTKFEYMGRRTEPLGAPYYVNEMGLCVRLCRCDQDRRTTPTKSAKNVVVDVWNVHLIEGRSKQGEKRRLKQAQELIDHIARVSNMDLTDKTLGRPRTAAERQKPLMEPKAKVERLAVVDPSSAGSSVDGVFPRGGLHRSVLDIESNKEDHVGREMARATDMDLESKEHEPGNSLQELFRSKMNKAIIISNEKKLNERATEVRPDTFTNDGDYDSRKRNLSPPPASLKYPVIACGNFNCAPYPDEVTKDGKDKDKIQPFTYSYLTYNSEASRNNQWLQQAYDALSHAPRRWTLDSAYASCFGEPSFTVWPDKKQSQLPYPVDYCFFTKNPTNGLAVLGVLEPLPEEWVKAGAARSLPCHSFPSDHIPLICDFEFRQS